MNKLIEEIMQSLQLSCNDVKKLDMCLSELTEMEETDSISKGTMLDEFYKIWKSKREKPGTKNEVNIWVAYFLGITSKKPDKDKSFPSRRIFARAGFPDIDVDFEFEKRQKVYDYIIEKYGRDRVGNIGTYGTLKLKSYVTRVTKALDLANSFHKGKDAYVKDNNILVRQIIDSLPEQRGAFLKVWDDDGEHIIKSVNDAYDYCDSFKTYLNQYPDIKKNARAIEGLASNFGMHAAGIVISDCPLKEIAPLRFTSGGSSGKSVDYATQFPYEDLESLGLIKFDILALSTLSVISKTIDMIKDRSGIEINLYNLDLKNEKTFELYRSGNLIGVFQCEEKGMQKTMVEMGVDRFEDICAGIALFRPGPMASIPKYCMRKRGKEKIDYFHSSIEPYVKEILEPTYGVLCYQESIMQLCNKLAGLSISDGYVIIKAVGKKKEDLLRRYKSKFVNGCVKNKIKEKLADDYWERFIMPFAAYGFNKCLSGDTKLHDAKTGESWKISDLSYLNSIGKMPNIKLWSKDLDNNKWFTDDLEDVFCTGEKEVFKIELCNGTILECTENHKFLCTDGIFREVKDIFKGDFSIDSENMSGLKIKSITSVGIMKTYNCTMASKHHNYAIIDEATSTMVCSKNSHSFCYGLLSYQTAYLKANFPYEFMLSYLNVELGQKKWERVEILESECKKMGIKIASRSINTCKELYTLEMKKDINDNSICVFIPSLFCKGITSEAVIDIRKNQPYKDIKDIAFKTSKSAVDIESMQALIDNEYFPGVKDVLGKFQNYREYFIKSKKRGVSGLDLFN
jgi:DNA polymerase III alpha subunit